MRQDDVGRLWAAPGSHRGAGTCLLAVAVGGQCAREYSQRVSRPHLCHAPPPPSLARFQIGKASLCRCDKYTSDNWQLVIPHGASTAYWVQNGRRRALRKLRTRSDPGSKKQLVCPASPSSSAVGCGNTPPSPRHHESGPQPMFRAPRSPARAIPAPSPRRGVCAAQLLSISIFTGRSPK